MSDGDDEARRLRNRLEAAQSELKKATDELVTVKAQLVAATEEAQFLRWSLEGGESKGLILALAESRAECARLQRQLDALRTGGAAAASLARSRVCLIAVTHSEGEAAFTQYVGFVIEENGRTRDVVRSFDLEAAKTAVDAEARVRGLPIEDLT